MLQECVGEGATKGRKWAGLGGGACEEGGDGRGVGYVLLSGLSPQRTHVSSVFLMVEPSKIISLIYEVLYFKRKV